MSVASNYRLQLINLVERLGLLRESVDQEQLMNSQEEPIAALEALHALTEKEAIEEVSKALGIRSLNTDTLEISHKGDIQLLAKSAPLDLCWRHKMAPVIIEDEMVVIACANPLDMDGIKGIEFAISQSVKPAIAEEKKILNLMSKYFQEHYSSPTNPTTNQDIQIEAIAGQDDRGEAIDQKSASTPPIVKLVNKLLFDAVQANASDIHIEPTKHGADVRFRIDGNLRFILNIPARLKPYVISRIKVISNLDIAEKRRPQDGRLRIRHGNTARDVRISTIPSIFGEKVVLRLLRASIEELQFSDLGFPPDIESAIRKHLSRKGKALLVTGPTGSGKTTSLYASINVINNGNRNIQTVEDPIEFRVSGITQVQVNEAAGLTFASALRSMLRQDPDVLLIGEIRDEETAKIAFQAAQTGHLVLSTLHTNDAPTALVRLRDLGVEPFVISSCLSAILSQRLVRKICPHCKGDVDYTTKEKYRSILNTFRIDSKDLKMGRGCEDCQFQGYSGRIGIYSLLEVTECIGQLLAKEAPLGEITAEARRGGFRSISARTLDLLLCGVTSLEEAAPLLDEEETQLLYNYKPNSTITFGTSGSASATNLPQTTNSSLPQHAASTDNTTKSKQQSLEAGTEYPLSYNRQSNESETPSVIPRSLADSGKPAKSSSPNALVSGQRSVNRQRILLLEDDDNTRAIFAILLQRELYDVIQATNGQDGLNEVYQYMPDAVLCDLMMPVMNGKEFLIRMRSNNATRDIPIIFLTSVKDENDEADLICLGATDFINKTASPKVILARLRRVLGG